MSEHPAMAPGLKNLGFLACNMVRAAAFDLMNRASDRGIHSEGAFRGQDALAGVADCTDELLALWLHGDPPDGEMQAAIDSVGDSILVADEAAQFDASSQGAAGGEFAHAQCREVSGSAMMPCLSAFVAIDTLRREVRDGHTTAIEALEEAARQLTIHLCPILGVADARA